MSATFGWHPAARLFDAAGNEVASPGRGAGTAARAVFPDSAAGLAAAIGHPAFRIGAPDQPPPAPHEEPVLETLTSGSMGRPRRIRRTQRSWIASFAVTAGLGIGPGARVATLGHLIHSLSLYGAVEGLHLGAEVHLLAELRPDRQRRALRDRRITHLYATPAQLRLILGPGQLPDLRLVLVGGAKLDPALRAVLAALAPEAAIREFYGAAETSFVTLADATTPAGSVGRPYPGVELRLDPGGEIWVRSPYLCLGPAFQPCPDVPAGRTSGPVARAEARPEASAPALLANPHGTRWRDGWLSVGEIGEMRAGHLYLKGRAGRMVTVADQNVFPEEIETFLLGLAGIARAAVLPVPDARRGQSLVAVLQGDPGQEAAILRALRAELGPLKAPKAVIWRQDWPVLASGKTDLNALEADLWPG
ncbi:AMP-binding protein [Rhodobacter calidifons]|uniref:Long-chain fatty acid--CoA ligase n=1 Tax=Rhodobacter calidifons TaxID=2715277 RepID=A0ABX0G9J1_9RHOB|nr:AMP-binding protein [Rhodobacter calidifons]NHB77538.1 long-chain fatty acid--CoA ligase [Rhodobacter calidifons]